MINIINAADVFKAMIWNLFLTSKYCVETPPSHLCAAENLPGNINIDLLIYLTADIIHINC